MKAFQNNALRWRIAVVGLALGYFVSAPAVAGTVTVQVTADGKAATNAIVFATPKSGAPAVKAGAKAVIVQESKQFVPFVLPVQVGTTVDFPNHDPYRHHVYSFSPAKTFELKLYGGGESQSVTFDKEGAVALGCNIHDNMLAYVYVVSTPYFLKITDGQGRLPDLPAGEYTIKAWHPDQRGSTLVSQDIVLADTGTADVKLNLNLKRDRRQRAPGAVDENAY